MKPSRSQTSPLPAGSGFGVVVVDVVFDDGAADDDPGAGVVSTEL